MWPNPQEPADFVQCEGGKKWSLFKDQKHLDCNTCCELIKECFA